MTRFLITALLIAAACAHPSGEVTHLAWACGIASAAETAEALVRRWLR
jgi:hypothetical protein